MSQQKLFNIFVYLIMEIILILTTVCTIQNYGYIVGIITWVASFVLSIYVFVEIGKEMGID